MHITPKDSSSCKHAATSIKAPHCHQRQNKPPFCSSLHSTAPSSAQIDKLCYFWTCLRMICFAQTMVTLPFYFSLLQVFGEIAQAEVELEFYCLTSFITVGLGPLCLYK